MTHVTFGMISVPYIYSLISSFSNFLTSSFLVRFFRLTAPAAMLGHLGAISLKNLTKRKKVRKLEKELIRLYDIVAAMECNFSDIST